MTAKEYSEKVRNLRELIDDAFDIADELYNYTTAERGTAKRKILKGHSSGEELDETLYILTSMTADAARLQTAKGTLSELYNALRKVDNN